MKQLPTQTNVDSESQEVRESTNFWAALHSILSWRSYTIFLATAWVYNTFEVLILFYSLYLRYLGWTFLIIGFVSGINTIISGCARLVGGYIGDTFNRKTLSVLTMACVALFYLITALFVHPGMIIVALLIISAVDIVKGGSSAYILDHVPRKNSGLAISLFTSGKILGVVTLVSFNVLTITIGFGESFRFLSLIAGLSLSGSTIVRAYWLEPDSPCTSTRDQSLWHDFFAENWRALKTIVKILPGTVIIIMLDAISDGLFKFGALLYANEFLGISIAGLGITLTFTLLLSFPLLFKVGRLADIKGIKKSALLVYSMMPLSSALLFFAPIFPTWGPEVLVVFIESWYPEMRVIFSTVFVAIILKYVNDTLWWLLVLTLIQKSLPRKDTAKFLAILWFVIRLITSLGPFLGGFIFSVGSPATLFEIAVIINIIILVVIFRNGLSSPAERTKYTEKQQITNS